MPSTSHLTKVKNRINYEKEKLKENSKIGFGIMFVVAAIAAVFFPTMYGPFILGALGFSSWMFFSIQMMTKDRILEIGNIYKSPFVLMYIESSWDKEKDVEKSISNWFNMTRDVREKEEFVYDVAFIVMFIVTIVFWSGILIAPYWLLSFI